MSARAPERTTPVVFCTTAGSSSEASLGNAGHRERLLERYIKNGAGALHPHEIFELLLTFTIPRRDTKRIARRLIDKYRTVGAVCNAPFDELLGIDGIGRKSAALLALVRDILAVCLKERYEHSSVMAHRDDVQSYLRFTYGHRRDEYVAALFLDSANHVIETSIVAEGTVNQCALYPRTVFGKAFNCGAASLIIAHNHPAGTPEPSESDWLITERLLTAGRMLDLPLLDHILVCRDRVISLRELPRWPNSPGRRTV